MRKDYKMRLSFRFKSLKQHNTDHYPTFTAILSRWHCKHARKNHTGQENKRNYESNRKCNFFLVTSTNAHKDTCKRSPTQPHIYKYIQGLSRHICARKGNLNHPKVSLWKEDKWAGVCQRSANEHTAIVAHSCRLISYESPTPANKERVRDSPASCGGGEV